MEMLKKSPLFLVFPLLFSLFSCAQPHFNKDYLDLVITGGKGFALTQKGNIDIFDTNTNLIIHSNIHAGAAITAIGADANGLIVVAEENGEVARLNTEQLTFYKLFKSPDKIFYILYDQKNRGYLVTEKGITNLSTKKTSLADTTVRLNSQVRGWSKPTAVFMGANGDIWLGNGFGEWGGELFVFSTRENKFIKPAINKCPLEPVKTIFSDGKNVYISSGVQHMFTYGCILKFTKYSCDTLFVSESGWTAPMGKDSLRKRVYGEYIGPAAYNYRDNCIYFYSQNGIFKGYLSDDLSKLNSWTKLASPNLHWKNGQPDAVGSPMNILKIEFADNGKLFLVTQNDGIGLFDGRTFKLLN
jgi:hypothetical protein